MPFVFTVEEGKEVSQREREFRGGIICGYTGRDQAAVRQHIDELAREGIEPPPMVPMYFAKPVWGLSMAGAMQVEGARTSGEVEFVLLMDQGELYVGLGSDHTDRELEKLDIAKSKQVCLSMIGGRFWKYSDLEDHWDQIEMRSWVLEDGQKTLYQETSLAAFLRPQDLLNKLGGQGMKDLDGMPVFCGTSPLLTESFVFARRFEAEMYDPVAERRLGLGYDIEVLDWFHG